MAKQDIWVTPYYDYTHLSDDGNTSRANVSRVSFMAGYDRALSNNSAFGFLFGYSQPKLQQVYSRVIADDYLFGLHYNTRICNDYELKLWGSYGTQRYRLTRNVPIGNGEDVAAKYSGNSWTGSIQVAKPCSFSRMGVIRPLVAVDYSFVEQNDAVEDGNSYYPIALKYNGSDWSQLFGRVGIRSDFGWKHISLTSSLSYSYQFAGDVAPTCRNQFLYGGPEFDVKAGEYGRSLVHVGLGSQIYLNRLKSRMFFIQYNGTYASRTNAQNASLGYQVTF
jgi:outer membrane autotransporter protein